MGNVALQAEEGHFQLHSTESVKTLRGKVTFHRGWVRGHLLWSSWVRRWGLECPFCVSYLNLLVKYIKLPYILANGVQLLSLTTPHAAPRPALLHPQRRQHQEILIRQPTTGLSHRLYGQCECLCNQFYLIFVGLGIIAFNNISG